MYRARIFAVRLVLLMYIVHMDSVVLRCTGMMLKWYLE